MTERIQYASVTFNGDFEPDRSYKVEDVSHKANTGEYVITFSEELTYSVITVSHHFLSANDSPFFVDVQRLVGNKAIVRTLDMNGTPNDRQFNIFTYEYNPPQASGD